MTQSDSRRIEISEPDEQGNCVVTVYYDGQVYEAKQIARSGQAIGFQDRLPDEVSRFVRGYFNSRAIFDSVENYELLA